VEFRAAGEVRGQILAVPVPETYLLMFDGWAARPKDGPIG